LRKQKRKWCPLSWPLARDMFRYSGTLVVLLCTNYSPVPRMLPLVDTIWPGTSGTVSVLVDIALPRGNITAGDFTSSFPVTATFAAGQAQVNVSLTLSPGAVEGL
jgi:hypothetical protein